MDSDAAVVVMPGQVQEAPRFRWRPEVLVMNRDAVLFTAPAGFRPLLELLAVPCTVGEMRYRMNALGFGDAVLQFLIGQRHVLRIVPGTADGVSGFNNVRFTVLAAALHRIHMGGGLVSVRSVMHPDKPEVIVSDFLAAVMWHPNRGEDFPGVVIAEAQEHHLELGDAIRRVVVGLPQVVEAGHGWFESAAGTRLPDLTATSFQRSLAA